MSQVTEMQPTSTWKCTSKASSKGLDESRQEDQQTAVTDELFWWATKLLTWLWLWARWRFSGSTALRNTQVNIESGHHT